MATMIHWYKNISLNLKTNSLIWVIGITVQQNKELNALNSQILNEKSLI